MRCCNRWYFLLFCLVVVMLNVGYCRVYGWFIKVRMVMCW